MGAQRVMTRTPATTWAQTMERLETARPVLVIRSMALRWEVQTDDGALVPSPPNAKPAGVTLWKSRREAQAALDACRDHVRQQAMIEAGILCAVLPWPKPTLSPNRRGHWATKASAVKTARRTAGNVMLAAIADRGIVRPVAGPVKVILWCHPPDRRRRDWDNLVASCKAYIDGIADALRVDDSKFQLDVRFGDPVKDGRIEVQIPLTEQTT